MCNNICFTKGTAVLKDWTFKERGPDISEHTCTEIKSRLITEQQRTYREFSFILVTFVYTNRHGLVQWRKWWFSCLLILMVFTYSVKGYHVIHGHFNMMLNLCNHIQLTLLSPIFIARWKVFPQVCNPPELGISHCLKECYLHRKFLKELHAIDLQF